MEGDGSALQTSNCAPCSLAIELELTSSAFTINTSQLPASLPLKTS
jgi:hypothetical protein